MKKMAWIVALLCAVLLNPAAAQEVRVGYIDGPRIENDTKRAFDTLFRSDCPPDQIAAIFFEPVQGEGGYNIATPEFVEYLRDLCDAHGIVLVADEIQSGMGRTGKMFVMEHFGIHPDLSCVGKSIGGGSFKCSRCRTASGQ